MRISFNWLNEMVETGLSPEELAEKLTMAGMEVEKIERPGEKLNNVVVGKVLSVERHPNADKLTVCRVDSGQGELQIICGAPNVRAEAKVALGLVGAVLAGGNRLRNVRIRGVESQGMICSEAELELGDDAAGIIILPEELELGQSLASALGLDDAILVIDVMPNRPDCLSTLGIAREVAAVLDKEIPTVSPEIVEVDEPASQSSSVETRDFELCPRYCARILTGVKIGPSPEWLKRRIELCGARSINNIVDATNYVMMEMGQPLHAFDLEKLTEKRIVVRGASQGETIVTLDGEERRLSPHMLVIADARRPVAIAGVMGGANTEVDEQTTSILLESAYFNPSSIRRTSRELGLSTEASYRFERGADPEAQALAATRAAELMRQLAGGEVKQGVIEAASGIPARPEVRVRYSRINLVLGTSLSDNDIGNTFSRLGVELVGKDRDALVLKPPSFRRDLSTEIDFIEEVARIYGYDRIPMPVTRAKVGTARRDPWQTFETLSKNVLTGLGFFEIISSDLISEQQCDLIADLLFDSPVEVLRVLNPVSAEKDVLRPTLLHGVLECLARNRSQNQECLRLFEIGRIRRWSQQNQATERPSLCLGMSGLSQQPSWDSSPREVDFYDVKGVVETYLSVLGIGQIAFRPMERPLYQRGRSASVSAKGSEIGHMGELSSLACRTSDLKAPAVVCELDAEALVELMDFSIHFKKLAVFPGSSRDISIIVDETVTYEEVTTILERNRPKILESMEIFDVYRGEQVGAGKKSMAFSLRYRSKHGTLTDEEVEAAHSAIKKALTEQLACEIREKKGA
jgi:phenylalanyl-tRNA synthetase beta chain